MKIELGKTYQTRRGFPVRIYSTDDGGSEWSTHGAYRRYGRWNCAVWDKEGRYCGDEHNPLDLIEVPTMWWINVYQNDDEHEPYSVGGVYKSRDEAVNIGRIHPSYVTTTAIILGGSDD